MSPPFETHTLSGWGRMAPAECRVYRPEDYAGLQEAVAQVTEGTLIARGLGRSYGDTSVNGGGGVIDLTRLNRMISFDDATGVLECECGVSIADILDTFVPRGFFPPVTPGTKFVTVGGAIANDIHGKNHHGAGTFGQFVESFELLTPSGAILHCSREENADVFWATMGGIGLTGFVLRARVRLQPVRSAWMQVDYRRCANLDDALEWMAASGETHQYSVAWVDCLARGKNLGLSVVMDGNHAGPDQVPAKHRDHPLRAPDKREKVVPFDAPGFTLNPLSIKAFNTVYYAAHPTREGAMVDYDSYFYPLDVVHHWNRMYGKRGFAQYQATLPPESKAGLIQLLERLSATRRASFLAVLKFMGEGNPGLLSHPIKGYTLTLDIANKPGLIEFLHELDRILLDHGGRLYLAKDVAATAATLAAMYPRLDEFRAIKGRLDPEGRLSSSMARRLGIVER